MVAAVDEIAQEQVVVRLNVSTIVGRAPQIEESHQVLILAVNIAEDFHRSINA